MVEFNSLLLVGSILVLLSILLARISNNLGVPTLILFLAVGAVARASGFAFDDFYLAQQLGNFALILILFSGGLDTDRRAVAPVWKAGVSLATIGVIVTAVAVALVAHALLDIPPLVALLLGAVISSTDAAAVFAILRARAVRFRGKLNPLIEFESGTNDPMAVFLTITVIDLILRPQATVSGLFFDASLAIAVGLFFGIAGGYGSVRLINVLRSQFDGLYPVMALACALLIYSMAAILWGSGFLAVYLAGLIIGNSDVLHRKNILRFFDGTAWLAQILMFIVLGFLVNPNALLAVAPQGLLIAFALMFLARPLGVFCSLPFGGYHAKEKCLIAWVGLRGAVPIILATYPLLAQIPEAELIFNVVFFVVLTSTIIQGWSVAPVARLLGLDKPVAYAPRALIDISDHERTPMKLVDLTTHPKSAAVGRSLVDLHLPRESLIVLIRRAGDFVIPAGETTIAANDQVQILTESAFESELRATFGAPPDKS